MKNSSFKNYSLNEEFLRMERELILTEQPHFSNLVCPICSSQLSFDPRVETWSSDPTKNSSYLKMYELHVKKYPLVCECCKTTLIYDYEMSGHNKLREPQSSEMDHYYMFLAAAKMRLNKPNQKQVVIITREGSKACKPAKTPSFRQFAQVD